MWEKSERIGKMLVNMGLVDEDQVKESLKLSSDNGKTLGQNMYELGYVTDSSLLQLLVAQGAATPWFLSQDPPEQRILRLLSTSVMREHMLIPIIRTGDLLLLAIADAKDHNALERVRTLTGLRVECVEAQPERIKEVIETVMNAERGTAEPEKASKEKADSKKKGKKQEEPAPEEAAAEQTPEAPPQTEQPDPAQTTPVFTQSELAAERPHPHKHGKPQSDEAQLAQPRITVESEVVSQDDTAPVAGLVDQIIADSVRRGATEILVESTSEGLSIRYRIEGQLRSIGDVPKSLAALVDARFRLLASMDIHDVDTAQVGKAEYKTANRTVKFDVCVVPTSSGSRFMFRSLPERIEPTLLEELGLAKNELGLVRESLDHSEGLLLVAGPTIEDRTAALYSLLMDLASPARDIVTCEENIYGSVPGVSHSNVKVRHSRSRSDYLTLLLKHAPDVLMVDNVSDDATAHSAVRTALAGRFVAAGIEAKGALNTIARLFDLGIDPYLVSASLRGVLAKRTLRSLCPTCKKKDGKVWKSIGCGDCEGTGYKGTTDVFEFLPMTDAVARLIATRAPVGEIEAAAKKAGFKPMTEHAAMKLERGETDEREISNVFSRPIAQEPLDANLEGMVPETEAKVEAAAVEKTEAESARDEYAEEIKKERDEMNAFLKMQSYEYDTGYIDDAA